MKIVVTGSLGNISKPLTNELVQKGHSVKVISSNPARKEEIEAMGAEPAIGTLEDVEFITSVFTGADVVYCMLPGRRNFTGPDFDLIAYANKMVGRYVEAIQKSGVKHIVYLSSVGAHTDTGNGILIFHHNAEVTMNKLPEDVNITFMRPVGFYYNLLAFINGIKTKGVMASNYGGEDLLPWVAPKDIATAVAEELEKKSTGRNIRYVASEEITCNAIAQTLGSAIGKPDLKWITVSNEQALAGMQAAGMNAPMAAGFVALNAAMHDGTIFDDYYRNKPALGKTKMADFAKDFAAVYNQK